MQTNELKEKIDLAISFLVSRVGSVSRQTAELLQRKLERNLLIGDDVSRAEAFIELLREYGAPPATSKLQALMLALKTLKEFSQQLKSDPSKALTYEFYVGATYDYPGGHSLDEPIDSGKLTGGTYELALVLSIVDAKVEWQPRTNGHKASFVIKAS